jgi:small subunit ribosomal protein S1
MHTAQMEKFAAADAEAASRPVANGASRSDDAPAGGSLASDEQLAALREKLAGSA